ncbi:MULTISPECIES: DUF4148 domain-containing protein [Burkholderia]|jgi:hypothetical protein|uniref:DUF4148 domain-containing protein n=2 Tax=Burkholderia contaminans TaxID=488447 RepID=A0A1E3FVN2_9BURK|nr:MULTISPECIES: DUF4148 domain-containing protein [Burkholderia]UTP26964.1 DUF4148 domain-containing protein [Burkholderia sp. FXe9]KKL42728.1 hypothetical protein WR31_12635 [Burkholderia contaminans LMG 23361]MBA9831214.1 DUF4148 domain-containing protein [Burkholderia contaminans]MBA9839466.1 DUF4148 domain-containing protein [Burkholderia contaminans]MBA9864657.1 DUF4148 domain-containing protein [Burkholderia contaminans]
MTTRFLAAAAAAVAALAASGPLFAQSAPGLTREQVRQDMLRYEAAGFNPARMNPRSWVDDAQAAAARVQAGRADDARTQLAVHGATTRCD